jgi:signal transduction histidine kinase
LRLDFPAGELGALATAFDRYLGRLRAFIERERAFTADVSHELRTPLAVIQGAAEIEAENPDLSPRQRQRALRIQRAAQEMAEIITALLALAREEGGPVAQDLCPLAEVVRNGAERYRHLIAQRPVELVVEVAAEPRVPADRALVRIVVANLIRNALEHTDQGQVLIRLEEGRLLVRDTGRGIAAAQLSRLFQRHYKGSASQGEGIGLSLTKRICDRYGWEIEVESEEGRGTEVRLLFA